MSAPLTFKEFATIIDAASLQTLDSKTLKALLNYCGWKYDQPISSYVELEEFFRAKFANNPRPFNARALRELWFRYERSRDALGDES